MIGIFLAWSNPWLHWQARRYGGNQGKIQKKHEEIKEFIR
jgi:hypothetical protein